jgi:hypothetical protein
MAISANLGPFSLANGSDFEYYDPNSSQARPVAIHKTGTRTAPGEVTGHGIS